MTLVGLWTLTCMQVRVWLAHFLQAVHWLLLAFEAGLTMVMQP